MEMNALHGLFPTLTRAARLAVAASACALTAGCIGDPFGEAKVDPASPVAADVARMTNARTDFPSFRDIPAKAADVRPLALYGRQANDLEADGARIERETAPGTWTLDNTTGFAEGARRDVGPDLPPPTPADAEAFARELRERATPPPRR
jgi:hypothetical protein